MLGREPPILCSKGKAQCACENEERVILLLVLVLEGRVGSGHSIFSPTTHQSDLAWSGFLQAARSPTQPRSDPGGRAKVGQVRGRVGAGPFAC